MKIHYGGGYCYHYMNCLDGQVIEPIQRPMTCNFCQDFEVEVTEYAVYINVGHNNVEICVI